MINALSSLWRGGGDLATPQITHSPDSVSSGETGFGPYNTINPINTEKTMFQYSEGFARVAYQNGSVTQTVAAKVSPQEAYQYPPISGIGSLRLIYIFIPGCIDPLLVDHNDNVFARVGGEYQLCSRVQSPKVAA